MKKCVVIYNPTSGKHIKKNFLTTYVDMLLEKGYDPDIVFSKYKGHIVKIMKELSDDVDLVISIGGDGTFNEAMNGNIAREKRLLMAHIPVGTTNDIGVMFGYGKDLINNLKMLLDGSVKKMDICTVNGKAFVYVAGFGKFMNIPYETTKKQKSKFGYLAYLVNGVKEFFSKTKSMELSYKVDDEVYHGLYSFAIISNANRIAGINNFYNDVKLNDGKFEVMFCNITRKKDILKSLYYLTTSDITKVPGLYFHKTDNLQIAFKNNEHTWCIDGEKLDNDNNVYDIRVVKDIMVMLPSGNVNQLFEE